MTEESTSYVPGVCNINTQEIARRKKAGYFGLVLLIVVAALLFGLELNRYLRIVLFIPLFIAAIGFLQAKHKFCVGYGAAGLQNAENGSHNAHQVVDRTAVAKDKKRTTYIYIQAIGASVIITLLLIVI